MFQCSTERRGEDYFFLSVLLCDTAHVTNNEIHVELYILQFLILQDSTLRYYIKSLCRPGEYSAKASNFVRIFGIKL